jgi:hypothetical protein
MSIEEVIRQRIAELERELEKTVTLYQAVIGELRRLLPVETPPQDKTE